MRPIISVPRLPFATWKTRILLSLLMMGALDRRRGRGGEGGLGRIELLGPGAQGAEALILLARQRRWVAVALVGPDVHVGLELLDDETGHGGAVPGDLPVVLARLAADPHGEPHVAGGVVDRRHRGHGAVVDHAPALGDRAAQAGVDRLHPAGHLV